MGLTSLKESCSLGVPRMRQEIEQFLLTSLDVHPVDMMCMSCDVQVMPL